MNLIVPIDPQDEVRLAAAARSRGVSLDELVRPAVEKILTEANQAEASKQPSVSLRGLLAKYGPAPSAEEIDLNRTEMFADFPRGAS